MGLKLFMEIVINTHILKSNKYLLSFPHQGNDLALALRGGG